MNWFPDVEFSKEECIGICDKAAELSLELDKIKEDSPLCCDFEQWSDGSYNCDLYKGNDIEHS
mgnify:FL=1